MTYLGITGHQSIPEAANEFVAAALEREIELAAASGPPWGVTSLAAGADQLFADLVLQAGGKLHVVIPCVRYDTTFDKDGLSRYRRLLATADEVQNLGFLDATEEAFFAAGREVVALSDTLFAVWDGMPVLRFSA